MKNNPITTKLYYRQHRKKILAYNKGYRKDHKEECKKTYKKWCLKHKCFLRKYRKIYSKIYYQKNKMRLYEQHRDYRNKDRARWCEYHRKYRDNDKNREIKNERTRKRGLTLRGNLDNRMRNGIGKNLQGSKNGWHWEALVGYTVKDLIKELESKFAGGMNWDNRNKWHIDHIVPLSRFKYERSEDPEFKICWGLANLQPLWAKDNLSKSRKTMDEWVKQKKKVSTR